MIDLAKGAYIALKTCLDLKEGEEFVVVTDEEKEEIGRTLATVGASLGAKVSLIVIQPTGRNGAEPPKAVANALKASDVFIAPTTYSISHTEARREATKKGARGATMPGITKEMFLRTMNIDYEDLAKKTEKLAEILSNAEEVLIKSEDGTDLRINIAGRKAMADTGLYRKPGEWGNLPAGEACLAPVSAEGTLVVNHWGKEITRPSKIEIRNGVGVKFYDDAKKVENVLAKVGDCAFKVAELGIGTNPSAKLSGNVLEDEKVLGTIHVAFGDNTSFHGGNNKCNVHEDLIVTNPTVFVDGKEIMKNGKLKI